MKPFRVYPIAALGLAAFAWRCMPPAVDVTGKACSVDRGCGPGFYCFQGACAAGDAPPATNLLLDPDFEEGLPDGGLPHWHVSGLGRLWAEGLWVHDGGLAAELLSTNQDGGTSARVSADSLLDAGQFTFCGTVWVYALDAGATTHVTLSLGARYDGGTLFSGGTTQTITPAPRWEQLAASIDTTEFGLPPDSLSFTVSTGNFPAGQLLLVDDAWLWRPNDGQCP